MAVTAKKPDEDALEELKKLLGDWRWRMNNLYYITDDAGHRVKFEMNPSQARLVEEMHYRNIILKARQLGFTTFLQLFMLDACLFNSNIRAGTIAHTLDDAKIIFRDKIKFPYDNLPDQIKDIVRIKSNNMTELLLTNNSSIRVGVSMRSGTLQYLHVSEYGKICAKFPEKAREVRTGALNTLHAGQIAFIESTAEGREGHFFDLCEESRSKLRRDEVLSELDFKFSFWPWWADDRYRLFPTFPIPEPMQRYFAGLEEQHGIVLDDEQKCWYVKQAEINLEDVKREYPSTPDEAFEASVEGAYFGSQMAKAELEGRIGEHAPILSLPVHTVWDIGRDTTAIWFWQELRGKIALVGYYQNSGEGMPFYIKVLVDYAKRLNWRYGNHWFPHDIKVTEWGTDRSRIEELMKRGIKAPKLVPEVSVDDGINAARHVLPFCYFNQAETVDGVRALKAYRKEWDEEHAVWKDKPLHNWASHGADAFRYLALAYREAKPEKPPPPPIEGIEKITLDELWKRQHKPAGTPRMI